MVCKDVLARSVKFKISVLFVSFVISEANVLLLHCSTWKCSTKLSNALFLTRRSFDDESLLGENRALDNFVEHFQVDKNMSC